MYFDLEETGETGTLRKIFGRHDVPSLYPFSRTNAASTNGTDLYLMANSADPDQLASSETNWSGSTLFAKARYQIGAHHDKG